MGPLLNNPHLGKHLLSFFDLQSLISIEKTCRAGKDASKFARIWEEFAQKSFDCQIPSGLNIRGKESLYFCQQAERNMKEGHYVTRVLSNRPDRFAFSNDRHRLCILEGKTISIFNTLTGELIREIKDVLIDAKQTLMAISDKYLAVTKTEKEIEVHNLLIQDEKPKTYSFQDTINHIALDNQLLLVSYISNEKSLVATDLTKSVQSKQSIPIPFCGQEIRKIIVTSKRIYFYIINCLVVLDKQDYTCLRTYNDINYARGLSSIVDFIENLNTPNDPLVIYEANSRYYLNTTSALRTAEHHCSILNSRKVIQMTRGDQIFAYSDEEKPVLQKISFIKNRMKKKATKIPSMDIHYADGLKVIGIMNQALVLLDFSSPKKIP